METAYSEGDFLVCKGVLWFLGGMYLNQSITKPDYEWILTQFAGMKQIASYLILMTSLPLILAATQDTSFNALLVEQSKFIDTLEFPIHPSS